MIVLSRIILYVRAFLSLKVLGATGEHFGPRPRHRHDGCCYNSYCLIRYNTITMLLVGSLVVSLNVHRVSGFFEITLIQKFLCD